MKYNITGIHFKLDDALKESIVAKLDDLSDKYGKVFNADVTLREIRPGKPETHEVKITLMVPGYGDKEATKKADSYEDAVEGCIRALDFDLEKIKEENEPAKEEGPTVYHGD